MEFNGTFLVSIITFIVFVFLMNKVLYAPILNIMEERKKFIDDNYKSAQDNDEKSVKISEEKETLLGVIKGQADIIVSASTVIANIQSLVATEEEKIVEATAGIEAAQKAARPYRGIRPR